jgi:Uri superfamily endonuclease
MLKIGRVYKIISTQGNECYVGSTFNTTRDRFKRHKQNFVQFLKKRDDLYCSCFRLFEKYGEDHCKMILIKEYKVVDKKHFASLRNIMDKEIEVYQ